MKYYNLFPDTFMVYTGCGKTIYAWRRGSELKHTYVGHKNKVQYILPFGTHIISVDAKSFVKVSIKTTKIKALN